jgi:hypothetical protein
MRFGVHTVVALNVTVFWNVNLKTEAKVEVINISMCSGYSDPHLLPF